MSKKQEKRNGASRSNNGNKNENPNKKEVVYPTRGEGLINGICAEKIGELEAHMTMLATWMTEPPTNSPLFNIRARLGEMEKSLLAQEKDILHLLRELRSLKEMPKTKTE